MQTCFKRPILILLPILLLMVLLAPVSAGNPHDGEQPQEPASELTAPTIAAEPLPDNVVVERIVPNGGGMLVALAFGPEGRLLYTIKGGFRGTRVAEVRLIQYGQLRSTPYLTTTVQSDDESGLIGITFDPNFASNRYIYIYKTAPASETGTGYPSNQVIRYTEDPTTRTAIPGSATILFQVPGSAEYNNTLSRHLAGNIHFGPDGKLYVTVGDYQNPPKAQLLDSPVGKIHRLNPDGTIPNDNPFALSNLGRLSVWSYGHRNSFDFTFDPVTKRMFFTENGPDCNDEVNLGQPGGNYGWPNDCATIPASSIAPLYQFPTPIGITGIEFYQGPIKPWHQTLFWCAINNGNLYHAQLDETRTKIVSVNTVTGAPPLRRRPGHRAGWLALYHRLRTNLAHPPQADHWHPLLRLQREPAG
jgi:glucose/arabinose dehydrogenase